MDNITHTLLGAALGETGLKRRSGLGMAALMISANIPDVDVVGLFFGENLAWRRGWTHGPLALLVLPVVLTAALVWWDRWQAHRGKRPLSRAPVHPLTLYWLSLLGFLSHDLLDFLNTYGIRLLMPFSGDWFYGNTLFIIDLWIWLVLGFGIWYSRRQQKRGITDGTRAGQVALGIVTVYTVLMALGSLATAKATRMQLLAADAVPTVVVASPIPLNPFRRDITYSLGTEYYGFGHATLTPTPQVVLDNGTIPTNLQDPAVDSAAARNKVLRDFLVWSRLPFAEISADSVVVADGRYSSSVARSRFRVGVVR
jgi:inner membrane protein